MLKKVFEIGFKVAVVAALLLLIFLALRTNDAIVYVDSQKLLIGYKGTQKAKKDFEAKAVTWKANLDTLRTEADNQAKEYETKVSRLSVSERKMMEELVKVKRDQFENYRQGIQEKIQKEDEELRKTVLLKVNDYIKQFGKDKGYRIILAANQTGNIVYAKEGTDITDQVLTGLNAEYH